MIFLGTGMDQWGIPILPKQFGFQSLDFTCNPSSGNRFYKWKKFNCLKRMIRILSSKRNAVSITSEKPRISIAKKGIISKVNKAHFGELNFSIQ